MKEARKNPVIKTMKRRRSTARCISIWNTCAESLWTSQLYSDGAVSFFFSETSWKWTWAICHGYSTLHNLTSLLVSLCSLMALSNYSFVFIFCAKKRLEGESQPDTAVDGDAPPKAILLPCFRIPNGSERERWAEISAPLGIMLCSEQNFRLEPRAREAERERKAFNR